MQRHDLDDIQVQQLWRRLRDDLRRQGASPETAEDIVQETWLLALRRMPQEDGRLGGWLRVVALRLWRRNRRREWERPARELAATRRGLGFDEHAPDELGSGLRACIEQLPEPYRRVLRMRYFEDMEVDEIARDLATKPATVYTHIRRGLSRLRVRVEPRERRFGLLPVMVWLREWSAWVRRMPRMLAATLALVAALPLWLLWHLPARSASRSPGPDLPSAAVARAGTIKPPAGVPEGESRTRATVAPDLRPTSLSGIVRTPDGQPLAGAQVRVSDLGDDEPRYATVTDEEGRFQLHRGGQVIQALHVDWCSSPQRYLASIQDPDRVELRMSPTHGSVQTVVQSHEGRPVPGATVRVLSAERMQQRTTEEGALEVSAAPPVAVTDELGSGMLVLPEDAEIEILVLAPDQPALRASFGLPEPGAPLVLDLPVPLELAGTCRDEYGQPVQRARVEVSQLGGLVVRIAETDELGCFSVPRLARGSFVLRAWAGRISTFRSGSLLPGETSPLELELDERCTLRGQVLDAVGPVAGSRLELRCSNDVSESGTPRVTTTDADGRFAFGGCDPAALYDLQIHRPGSADPCLGRARLRASTEELHFRVPRDPALAPVKLLFQGPHLPELVEIRRHFPALTRLLEADPAGSAVYRSTPLPGGDYRVFAWSREYGTWESQPLTHDPAQPRFHFLEAPEAATVVVVPEQDGRPHRSPVDVDLLVPAIHMSGLHYYSTSNARKSLRWSDAEGGYVGRCAPGEYLLMVRGERLADVHRTIELSPGGNLRTRAPLDAGILTTVILETAASGLNPGEFVTLEALTPRGSTSLELRWRDQWQTEDGIEFVVGLPRDTIEVRARTAARSSSGPVREGRRGLAAGALQALDRPRLRIPMEIAR